MKEIAKRVIAVLAILGIVLMAGAVIAVSWFSVFVSDDYWYAQDAGVKGVSLLQNFILSCKYAAWVYMTHQGTYFSEFFGVFFTPVTHGGFPMLRFWMVLNSSLVFITLLWFVNTFLDGIGKIPLYVKTLVMAGTVFAMTQYESFAEIYEWWVGASVYTFPFSLMLISATAFMLANRENIKVNKWVIISCVSGFCAVGASLAITGTACYLLLSLLIYYSVKNGKVSKSNIIMFGVSFIGALINAIAPGNFIRQSSEGELDLLKSIGDTFNVWWSNVNWLFGHDERTNYLAVFILFAICGFLVADMLTVNVKAWIIAGVFAIFSPFAVIFPVATGYNVPWMPPRCVFVGLFAFIYSSANLGIMLGAAINKAINQENRKAVLALLALACILTNALSGFNVKSYKACQQVVQLYRHEFQDHYNETRAMIEDFANHQGEDLVVDVALNPDGIENYYSFFLLEEADGRINQGVAWAYGLNSITNIRED